jgi:hypothetical protein
MNFCGAEKLPLSAHCCNIAPQFLGRSVFRGPGLRVGDLVPTSLLPLPTTAILFLR